MSGIRILPLLSVLAAAVLLAVSLFPTGLHPYLSALPLALAGAGYALLQGGIKPPAGVLWKRLLLAATFVMWAIDQLLPAGRAATVLGDVVIAAYVLDLYWLAQDQLRSADSGEADPVASSPRRP